MDARCRVQCEKMDRVQAMFCHACLHACVCASMCVCVCVRADFPLDISTTVYVNSRIIGSGLKARLVQYKKHKNPSQFNYWVTGLQKATNK